MQQPDKNLPEAVDQIPPNQIGLKKVAFGIATATGGNIAATLGARSVGNKEISPRANIVRVQGKNGYYDVVYSDHYVPNSVKTAEGMDALMLEQRMMYSTDGVNAYFEWLAFSADPEACQYREILQVARKDRIPVFFIDVSLSAPTGGSEKIRKNILRTIESALGVSIVGFTAAKIHQDVTDHTLMTRRALLSHAFRTTVAMYSLTPRLESLASSLSGSPPDESSFSRNWQKRLHALNSFVHPELNTPYTLDFRNIIMAQNAEFVSRVLVEQLRRKPTCALYVGSQHMGIESALKADERGRVQRIKDNPQLLHSGNIARVDFVEVNGREQMQIEILQDSAFSKIEF